MHGMSYHNSMVDIQYVQVICILAFQPPVSTSSISETAMVTTVFFFWGIGRRCWKVRWMVGGSQQFPPKGYRFVANEYRVLGSARNHTRAAWTHSWLYGCWKGKLEPKLLPSKSGIDLVTGGSKVVDISPEVQSLAGARGSDAGRILG